jgi:aryl-alcohol dehydrogenase-like predicted oxidoreductase
VKQVKQVRRVKQVKRIALGGSGFEISRVVFGSMGHGAASSNDRIRAVHAALDAGATSIDTAPLYDFGEVERVLGRAIRGRRAEVELLSKVGLRWDGDHGHVLFEFTDARGARRAVRRDSRPEAIRRDVEESLNRLQTDHIDLCQIHHPDPMVPIAESLGALEMLVAEGKVRHIGVSNFSAHELEAAVRAAATTRLVSDQLEYNLIERAPEESILPIARKHRLGILAYSPLDAGSLCGRLLDGGYEAADGRHQRASSRPANARAINAALRECAEPVARAHRASLAQISLAWLLHQPDVSGVIVGARTPKQAIANARASEIELSTEELDNLSRRFARVQIDPAAGLGVRALAVTLLKRVGRVGRKLGRLLSRG